MAFNNIGLQEPSTITARVATVTIQRGSTLEHQEILVLGDATSSNAVAQVTNAAPSTSAYGLAVRQVDAVQSAQSGAWTVRATLSSTGADNPVTAAQAGTWNIGTVTAVSSVAGIVAARPSDTNWASSAGFHFNSSGELLTVAAVTTSTTVNVSSLAGRVTVAPSDTNWASSAGFHFDSSGALQISGTITASASTVTTVSAFYDSSNVAVQPGDATNKALRVNVVTGGSTTVNVSSVAGVVQIGDKLGNGIESSTNAVGTNSTRRGLAVRPMLPLSTYASGQAASSGDVTVFTSVAGQSIYVYGVCLHWGGVMTTNTNQLVRLQDGNSTATEYMRWRFQVSAIGATTQPLQAFVAPPAYLFRTAAGTNLRINTASSGLSYSLQAWYE